MRLRERQKGARGPAYGGSRTLARHEAAGHGQQPKPQSWHRICQIEQPLKLHILLTS